MRNFLKLASILCLLPLLHACDVLLNNDSSSPDWFDVIGIHEDDFRFSPCSGGSHIHPDSLPSPVKAYLATNYPGVAVVKAEKYNSPDSVFYEVKLANRVEIYFNAQGQVISRGHDDSFYSDSTRTGFGNYSYADYLAAVEKAKKYIQDNYPDLVHSIDEIEAEMEYGRLFVKIKFHDGRRWYFNLTGKPVCNRNRDDDGYDDDDDDDDYDDHSGHGNDDDDDDDDDDDNNGHGNDDDDDDDDNSGNNGSSSLNPCSSGEPISTGNLPASIKSYLSTKHPGVSITKAEVYNFSEGKFYEVKLANGYELYFNADGILVPGSDDGVSPKYGTNTQAEYNSAVDKAMAYLRANHANLVDDIDKIQPELEFGRLFVRVRFDDDDKEMYFDLSGKLVCTEED